MVTHNSVRTAKRQSMRHGSPYVVLACSVILGAVSFLVGIEMSVATPWSGGSAPAAEIVRTGKGNRSPLALEFHRNAVNQPLEINVPRTPAPDQELIDGCEPLASSLTNSPFARVAGRCLS
jgi:hypothetical protein